MATGGSPPRVPVPVDPTLRQELREHPEAFGLEPGLSEARLFACLVEAGARALREQQQQAERISLYEAWADDPERHEAVEDSMNLAVKRGIL